jgi:hypothetical protein
MMLCGVDEHDDMRHERDALRSVLSDLVEERGLTDLLDLLKDVKNCVVPLADLLRMTHNSMPTATLQYHGELYRRVMELNEKLVTSHRLSAFLSADFRLKLESDEDFKARILKALAPGQHYTAEDLVAARGDDLDWFAQRLGLVRKRL